MDAGAVERETSVHMTIRPLPGPVVRLLVRLGAPSRLIAHLTLTHDVAGTLTEEVDRRWPRLGYDREAVLFGAATHDIGKTQEQQELFHPGKEHEQLGEELLLREGIPPESARFCRTHGNWNSGSAIEDLLVALADAIWKGKRDDTLEELVLHYISTRESDEPWRVYIELDDLLCELGKDADERLVWQGMHQ